MDTQTAFDRKYNYKPDGPQEYSPNEITNKTISFGELHQLASNHFIPSGIEGIDKGIGGFPLGKVVVIAGEQHIGKTKLITKISLHIATDNPLLYYSCGYDLNLLYNGFMKELSTKTTEQSKQSRFLKRGGIKSKKIEKRVEDFKLFFNNSYYPSIETFKKDCEKEITDKGIKVVVINYFENLGHEKNGLTKGQIDEHVMKALGKIARELFVSIIVISELKNYFGIDDSCLFPLIKTIPGSGTIDQNADTILFMVENGNGEKELVVGKGDEGKLGLRCKIH